MLARAVSLLTGQRLTDTTAASRCSNRKAIELFAADYPHDYPEVEAALMLHKHRLRLTEVPVRDAGARSRALLDPRRSRTVYYMAKVMLAILIGSLRRRALHWRTRDPRRLRHAAQGVAGGDRRVSRCCCSSSSS